MESEQFYTIVTDIGKAKIANASIFGGKVDITKFAVGDGGGAYYNPTENQTSLKRKVYEGNVSNISIDDDNPNWIRIESILPANVGGFMIRELGLYDTAGDLIAINKCPETYKPIAINGSTTDLILQTILAVSNAETVQLKIDPTVIMATKAEVLKVVDDLASKSTGKGASTIGINDILNIITSTDVEGALQEIMTLLRPIGGNSTPKLPTDVPNTYPLGLSCMRIMSNPVVVDGINTNCSTEWNKSLGDSTSASELYIITARVSSTNVNAEAIQMVFAMQYRYKYISYRICGGSNIWGEWFKLPTSSFLNSASGASEIGIRDSQNIIEATDVEKALQEFAYGIKNAPTKPSTDLPSTWKNGTYRFVSQGNFSTDSYLKNFNLSSDIYNYIVETFKGGNILIQKVSIFSNRNNIYAGTFTRYGYINDIVDEWKPWSSIILNSKLPIDAPDTYPTENTTFYTSNRAEWLNSIGFTIDNSLNTVQIDTIHSKNNYSIVQRATVFSTINSNEISGIFERCSYSRDKWGDWTRIATQKDINIGNYAAPNDTTSNVLYNIRFNPLPPNSYVPEDGFTFTLKPDVDCGNAPRIRMHATSTYYTYNLVDGEGIALKAGDLVAGRPYIFVKVGSNFFLRNGKGGVKMPPVVAADTLLISTKTNLRVEKTTAEATSLVKVIEATVKCEGTIRSTYYLRAKSSSWRVYSQLYKNGSPLGTLKDTTNTSPGLKIVEDLVVKPGDKIQIYAQSTGTGWGVYIDTWLLIIGYLDDLVDVTTY